MIQDLSANKRYIFFDINNGYPASEKIFYECQKCKDILPSTPKESVICKCKNISIDVDYGRVSVKDPLQFKIFSKE